MENFKNDNEIIQYFEDKITGFKEFEKHLLYREEQILADKNIFRIRNSNEWIFRINNIIIQLKYSLKNSMKFAKLVCNPIEESKEKQMYSYYLEDSVYRTILLWDIYKQLVNEFYSLGFNRHAQYSIFKMLKRIKSKKRWDKERYCSLEKYLNSKKHKNVRQYLRNKYTHSVDPTSMIVFHDENENGIITPDIDNIIPKHPYENIIDVIDDLSILIDRIEYINEEIKGELINKLMLVRATAVLPCGINETLPLSNMGELFELYNDIGVYAKYRNCIGCNNVRIYEGENTCKPIRIDYNRIHEEDEIKTLECTSRVEEEN